MKMLENQIIEAMQTRTRVWCWHNSSIHSGRDRSAVLIIRRRFDGWVLVRFDDLTQLWARESELEIINQEEETK